MKPKQANGITPLPKRLGESLTTSKRTEEGESRTPPQLLHITGILGFAINCPKDSAEFNPIDQLGRQEVSHVFG